MATLLLRKRLLNPGRRRHNAKRKLSPKQIKFFGSKAQRAALKRRRTNRGTATRHRRKNIGEIITFDLKPRTNSGKRRKNSMAVRRRRPIRRANSGVRRSRRRNAPKSWSGLYRKQYHRKKNSGIRRRRRTNSGVVVHRRRRRVNSGRRVEAYRRRRANSGRRRVYSRRRNSGYRRRNPNISGVVMKALGVTTGIITTNYLLGMVGNFSPSLATGPVSYATGIALAVGQGYLVGKVFKRPNLGEDIAVGGVISVVMKVLAQYMPSLGLSGLRRGGLGLLGNSSFTYPSILAKPGNFAQFQVAPDYQNAINAAAASAAASRSHGMGAIFPQSNGGSRNNLRRVGRSA